MAKKNKKSAAAAASDAPDKQPVNEKKSAKKEEKEEEEEEVDEVEEEMESLQVDVGDIIKVKQILDETVAGTMIGNDISAHGETVQIKEAYWHDNMKLLIMFVACCFAAVAQFGLTTDFPNNRIWLGVCCASYFFLSGILQFIMTFIDKDCIMTIQPLNDPEAIKLVKKGGNKYLDKYGIRVRTQFPRFSEFYSVILEFNGKNPPSEYVKQTWSVGQFFDVDGYFDEDGLMLEVEKLYRRFEAGKFDKPNGVGGSKSMKKKNK
jgi:signal peptidase complex subunit 2